MALYNYRQAIKDFVGKGGFVPFEHGFKGTLGEWGVSDTEVKCINVTWKIDELEDEQARVILRDLLEYLNYCQYYA